MNRYCLLCFKEIAHKQHIFDWMKQDALLCGDCYANLQYLGIDKNIGDLPVHILYMYNDFLENMIYQFKEGRDVALKNVFFHNHKRELIHKYRHYQICVLPSSKAKIEERGFQHMMLMLEELHFDIECPFVKIKNHKQSLQPYERRTDIGKYIHLKKDFVLKKKKVLLIDDVCTSGSTLNCTYNLLKQHTNRIEALVLCANPLFVESCDER